MLYKISYYFLLFLMYSFLGWCIEVLNSYKCHKRFVNRGFLIGPYCPIYGVGVLLIVSFLKNYMDNFLVLFVLAMAICMVLEYITSYLMEVIFNARWWDYSNYKFNINGRVCLETAIPFGIGGLIIMYLINPFFTGILDKINNTVLVVISGCLLVGFLVDLVVSFSVIIKFRNVDISKFKDDTEEIGKKVREYLSEHSRFTRRLGESFPDIKIRVEKFKKRYERLKRKMKKKLEKKLKKS